MPWRETTAVQNRHEFVIRGIEPGVNFSELCREFGVSRKTGYKWVDRYLTAGVGSLVDRPKRPKRTLKALSGEQVMRILELRRDHPRWGAKKLRVLLAKDMPDTPVPSLRSIHRVLERGGQIVARRRREPPAERPTSAPEVVVAAPNDLWTIDFKGWWRTRNGSRAEPLTVRDAHSRFVLGCILLTSTSTAQVKEAFTQLFERHGLPASLLMDNGSPFASTRARGGLTQLSAWFVSLGIRLHRSRPASPQDNGAHERMHADIADAVQARPAEDLDQQQAALEDWRREFNEVRPHEALNMETPASVYTASPRRYRGPKPALYPTTSTVRRVNRHGYVKFEGGQHFISGALAGHLVGLLPGDDGAVTVRFYDLDLGALS